MASVEERQCENETYKRSLFPNLGKQQQILTTPENENHAVGQNQKQVRLPNIELTIFEGKLED